VWLGAILALYLLSPIGAFVGRFATSDRIAAPGTASALVISAETATIATAVIALLGVPLAYVLAQGRSRRSTVVGVAVQLPIALPPLISGVLLLYVIGPQSAIGQLFDGRLTDDRAGIVLAQIFVSAPFLIIAARSAFAALDPALNDVATTLGHGTIARFLRVAVPAAMPAIVAGMLLSWLRAFGEFGATVLLAYHPYSLPVFTYVQFGSTGLDATLLPTAAALGTALVVLVGAAAASRRPLVSGVRRRPLPVAALRASNAGTPGPLEFEVSARAGDFVVHGCGSTGRTLAVIGASGAGKTLLVRALAGLVDADVTRLSLGGRNLATVRPRDRRIGYLPQESSLLPHLPVREQVGFGVAADESAVAQWIDRLGLHDLVDRRPDQLSIGQRRRVGLARALASEPRLLLLDEPLTGLDTPARDRLRRMLRDVLAEAAITTVVVTHDPADVSMLADDALVIAEGRTLQAGPVAHLYRKPASPLVAHLLGIPNAFAMTVVRAGAVGSADGLTLRADTTDLKRGTPVVAVVNPRAIRIGRTGRAAEVIDVVAYPDHQVVDLRVGTTDLIIHPDRGTSVKRGDQVKVTIPAGAVTVSAVGQPPAYGGSTSTMVASPSG
jgi:molybdate transport system permease protein